LPRSCLKIDVQKASMLFFDTSDIEAWTTENNPKYINRIIKQLKAFKKVNNLYDSYDPYKVAYSTIPSHANRIIEKKSDSPNKDKSLADSKAFLPLNGRLSLGNSNCPINEDGIPCCPMKREGSKTHLGCELPTMKFVCPKTKLEYNKVTKTPREFVIAKTLYYFFLWLNVLHLS
jgi:hypothetical protein